MKKPGLLRGIEIIYEDEHILAVNKPPGLLTISTDREKSKTAYFILTNYIRKGYAKSLKRLFIVHRLDRETSGIMLFAKSEGVKLSLQSRWKETSKKYLAVVHGICRKSSGIISSYLTENRAHVVYSTSDSTKGKLAVTSYNVLRQTRDLALLEIELLTGRKNQIRVHLAEHGHPIVGDRKYGKQARSHTRLALHAKSISFLHPSSGKQITLETPVPAYFKQLIG